MTTYLLIRSNKESGPYTLNDLLQLGLKPYDLIWVEGRSAAWRYPSEVDELKEYAPIVEEQPFDRFYKKPEEKKEKHFHELIEEARNKKEISKITLAEKKSFVRQENPAPKIYVSMPEQHTPSSVYSGIKKDQVMGMPETEKKIGQNNFSNQQTNAPVSSAKKTVEISSGLLHKNSPKKVRSTNYRKIVELSAAAVFIITFGTLVYLYFKPADIIPLVNSSDIQAPVINLNSSKLTDDANSTTSFTENNQGKNEIGVAEISVTLIPIVNQKKINELKPAIEKSDTKKEDLKTVSIISEPSGERIRIIRDKTESTKTSVIDISRQVSVIANEYKRRAFGGIENLELTVVNSSGFILDKVLVELQYLKPSELPLKTEVIQFSSIASNGSLTMKIPDHPRGIKVVYKIIKFESVQYEKDTAGL